MKISKNTPDLMVIDDRPWFIGLFLIGFIAIFASIGATMLYSGLLGGVFMLLIAGAIFTGFYFLVERTQLVLDASAGKLEIRKKSMRRMKRDKYALKELRHTTVDSRTSSSSSGNSTKTSRLVLVFNGENGETDTPLTAAYTSGGAAERISPVVNAWLEAVKS